MPSKKDQPNFWFFYPSEPFKNGHFNVRHPKLSLVQTKDNFSGSAPLLIYLRHIIVFDEIDRYSFIISNTSLESRFEPSHSVRHFSIFPFQMTIANIWWVSCEVFSNVQKNFTCRMNLASMCTDIFIRHLVEGGIETRKLNPRPSSRL